ncbi:hypothetical protein HMPREF1555_00370 [Porphyromonas gingivalis F0570]|uniref:Uncharacterized protein n=1 Tax=Porphyromonas gingivalis F0570 TaxID=1227271 RepID=A0A0E2LSL5_PORGN|nr:hypothetical protein HMPREF1555_00370 [Porphyromonas gingivalis F0570]
MQKTNEGVSKRMKHPRSYKENRMLFEHMISRNFSFPNLKTFLSRRLRISLPSNTSVLFAE